jgi:hypothetical protein
MDRRLVTPRIDREAVDLSLRSFAVAENLRQRNEEFKTFVRRDDLQIPFWRILIFLLWKHLRDMVLLFVGVRPHCSAWLAADRPYLV